MKYKWFFSDFSNIDLSSASVSFADIQGYKVPLLGSSFYYKGTPYNDVNFGYVNYFIDGSYSYFERSYNKFFLYDNVVFFTSFGRSESGNIPKRFTQYVSFNGDNIFNFGLNNVGLFYLYVTFDSGEHSFITDFASSDLDDFLVKSADYFAKTDNIKVLDILRVESFVMIDDNYCDVLWNLNFEGAFFPLIYPSCCEPDFLRIVQILGGSPSSNQLNNIKNIAFLLGCDTSENGLNGCALGSDYLKRISLLLGGSVGSDFAITLKEICRVLGVDTSENGLSGCELSKDYVKRISTMLGG